MLRHPVRPLSAALLLVCASCDGARDAEYAGEPLFVVSGGTTNFLGDGRANAHIGVFWIAYGPGDGAVEVPASEIALRVDEAAFELRLMSPPPEAAMRAIEGAELALGVIAAYADHDGDGARGAEEPWLGSSETMIGV